MKLEQEHRHGRNDDGGSCVVPVICRAEIDFYSCIVQISVYFSILLRYFMDVPNRFIVGKVPNLQQFGAICQYDQQTRVKNSKRTTRRTTPWTQTVNKKSKDFIKRRFLKILIVGQL
ncbi:hypothetical protein SUGI_0647560 [Cryptomeria japonica]|nr:hypothetical protein SUGI_0647560 [Cryptomeria japonica]